MRAKNGVRLALEMDTTNGYLMDKTRPRRSRRILQEAGIEIKDLRVIDSAVNAQLRAKQGAGYRDLMNSSSGPTTPARAIFSLFRRTLARTA